MIIKIMPENDAERATIQEVEHKGVKEFFIFGNKKDSEGEPIDFHDWKGSYRYLVGSLYYFTNMLADEQKSQLSANANKPVEIKLDVPQLEVVQDVKEAEGQEKGFIKTSNAVDGKIDGVVEVQEVAVETLNEALGLKLMDDEMPVEENVKNDNSQGAGDGADEPF